MLGQCPANVKEAVNTFSACSSSLMLPEGIATSIGAKTPIGERTGFLVGEQECVALRAKTSCSTL